METSMRAVVYVAPKQLELREVPSPRIGPEELLVKVRAATTCGTDLKTYERGYHLLKPPCLFGHEFSGDVVEVGSDVEGFKPGMRVVSHNSAPCQRCFYCKNEQQNLCEDLLFNFGTYAEYIVVPGPIVRLNTFVIPEGISYARMSILEPLVSVVHGQRIIKIQPGERVAIIGVGPIGLMHTQMALRSGASKVVTADLHDARLSVAAGLGAAKTINPTRDDPVSVIMDMTDGRGVDVAIESAGTKEAWLTAVKAVRKGGRVLWFGGLKKDTYVDLDTYGIHYGELSLHGTFHGTPLDAQRSYELITSGVIDTQALISGELPLERVEDALNMMKRGEVVKMAIDPGMSAN
jgi:L-iditol 2-dehydrogenase